VGGVEIRYTQAVEYTSDGVKLFYDVAGEGPAVVLLHPMPCSHRFWLGAVESLKTRYRVIIPDLRGMGQSAAGEGAITMEKLGADLVRLLDELQISQAMFAGCSIGGYTLYELWRRAPARVQALAFFGARPQADSEAARTGRQEWIEKIRTGGPNVFIDAHIDKWVGPTAQQRHPERLAEAREMMEGVTTSSLIGIFQGLAARPDSVETARGIRVPAFVLAGGEDTFSPPADMKLLAETIRNGGYGAEYTELRDAGHYAPWEQPEMVGRLLRRFFDSI
jgi:pimeloyl-ACP methyl ester carboxylesterase